MNWGFLAEGLFGGVVIAWGLWELHSLRREKRKDAEKARASKEAAPGHPEG